MEESANHPSPGQGRGAAVTAELPVPGGDRALAEEWALVLASQGLVVRVLTAEQGFALELAQADHAKAETAIAAYLSENRDTDVDSSPAQAERADPVLGDPSWAGVGFGLALLGLYALTGERADGHLLFARGSADAARILAGEWWRCVTALCLHADLPHALGNALAGLYFIGAVCRSLGTGLGLAIVLLAGASGNWLNAAAHTHLHDSVGASTAVFGAIGILAGVALVRRHRAGLRGRRRWMPIGAGLGLLALLGTGGIRVDLWAHFFGLLAGAGLGSAAALLAPQPAPARTQRLLGLTSLLALLFCWSLALR